MKPTIRWSVIFEAETPQALAEAVAQFAETLETAVGDSSFAAHAPTWSFVATKEEPRDDIQAAK